MPAIFAAHSAHDSLRHCGRHTPNTGCTVHPVLGAAAGGHTVGQATGKKVKGGHQLREAGSIQATGMGNTSTGNTSTAAATASPASPVEPSDSHRSLRSKLFRKLSRRNRGAQQPPQQNQNFADLGGAFAGIKAERVLTRRSVEMGLGGGAQPGRPMPKIGLDDFIVLKVLGRGSFGKVCLVRGRANNKLYALKALRKEALARRNQIKHTKTERNILQNIRHPFLVQLQFAFQSDTRLYLVLEFQSGGELMFWLKKEKRFGLDRSKLYAAEVLLGVEFLHKNDIVYRDLKPENVLVDPHGHLKLTDFGLSKEAVVGHGRDGGAKTFCGTPEYLAPEILESKGHGKAVDWWSLGILVSEMLTGKSPFYHKNVQQMYRKILHAKPVFAMPMPAVATQFLVALLERQVSKRLGSDPLRDARDIREHLFFAQMGGAALDWDAVLQKQYTPTFKPPASRLESMTDSDGYLEGGEGGDSQNFSTRFTRQSTTESPTKPLTEEQREQTRFTGFSYQGEEVDNEVLDQLRRDSRSSVAWEQLTRRSSLVTVMPSVNEGGEEGEQDGAGEEWTSARDLGGVSKKSE